MKTTFLAIAFVILIGMSAVFFFRAMDAALEIDDLKSQVNLQKNSLKFLAEVSNQSLMSCTLNAEKLELLAKEKQLPMRVEKQSIFIGSFEFTKDANSCISKVEQVAL